MIVLDTHVWIKWIINGDSALTKSVVNALAFDSHWAVSAISCFEVFYWLNKESFSYLFLLRSG